MEKQQLVIPDRDMTVREIAKLQWQWIEEMKWHNSTPLEKLAMIASEVGEVADEVDDGNPIHFELSNILKRLAQAVNMCRSVTVSDKLGEELADIILRSIDLAEDNGFDIQQELQNKMRKNLERGTRGREK